MAGMRPGLARVLQLCAGQGMVRALGFGMRVWLARTVSEETIGLFELACSCVALLLSPLVSGLPLAASRLTAGYLHGIVSTRAGSTPADTATQIKRPTDSTRAEAVTGAAVLLAAGGALCVTAPCALLARLLAASLGDARVYAPLMSLLPSVLPLAVCGALHGALYGRGSALPGVLQLTEQSARLLAAFMLVYAFPGAGPVAHASMLGTAASVGAFVSLALSMLATGGAHVRRGIGIRGMMKRVAAAAWPMSVSRVAAAGLRSVNQMLLPTYLVMAGLSSGEAMSALGVIAGMVMPALFLPGMVTGPMCTFAMPRAAACAAGDSPYADVRALAVKCITGALGVSAACAGAIAAFGPWMGEGLYRNALAGGLLRFMSPVIVTTSLCQMLSALLQGVSGERAAMRWQLANSLITCALMPVLCSRAGIGAYGFGVAMLAGQLAGAAGMGTELVKRVADMRRT